MLMLMVYRCFLDETLPCPASSNVGSGAALWVLALGSLTSFFDPTSLLQLHDIHAQRSFRVWRLDIDNGIEVHDSIEHGS